MSNRLATANCVAFDCHIVGVALDYIVQVRIDVLNEVDPPMLRTDCRTVQGAKLLVPTRDVLKPDHNFLRARLRVV